MMRLFFQKIRLHAAAGLNLTETFIVWCDDNQMIFGEAFEDTFRTVGYSSAETDVRKTFGNTLHNLFTVLTLNIEGNVRIFFPKSRDDLGRMY